MADQDPNNSNDGSGPDGGPQIAVITQYIKDLSVESPNSPGVFQWQVQPQVEVQFNINVNNLSEEVHAGLLGLRNLPPEAMGPFLLIEAPRMLFPFARQIVADAVQNTGFPPLLLEPIDFNAAYIQQLNALQQQEGAEGNGAAAENGEAPAEGTGQADS
jgi:preprotein translocase subunit SecB